MPGREILDRPAPPADLRVSYGPDPRRIVDFRFPAGEGPFPLVVHIHGGFWRNRFDLRHGGHVCAALTAMGAITANMEYRSVGDEGGGWPGTFDDVVDALRCARERAAAFRHDGRTIVSGHSAGGHLALWLAAEAPGISAVVALAPVAHLRQAFELNLGSGAVEDFLGGTPTSAPERYAAACPAFRATRVPRILVHGTNDDIVPVSISRAYRAALEAEPVEVRELAGADHFDVIDPESAAWSEVAAAFRQCTVAPK
jgi:acetyl esterase/lipase